MKIELHNNSQKVLSMPEIMAALEVKKTIIIRVNPDAVLFLNTFSANVLQQNIVENFNENNRSKMLKKFALYAMYNQTIQLLIKIAQKKPKTDIAIRMPYADAHELLYCLSSIPCTLGPYETTLKNDIIYKIDTKL